MDETDLPPEQQPEGPPQVPSFTSIAAGAPTWTATDDINYARKAASLGQLQNEVDEGMLYPHHAAEAAQDLVGSMRDMNQRKQAADALKQQTATQAALAQNAMQRSVEQTDMQHRAAMFQNTMHMFKDPTTGDETVFYQRRPGEWEPLQRKNETPADLTQGIPGLEGQPSPVDMNTDEGAVAGSPPGAVEGAGQGSGEGGPAAAPFTQTIYNGPNKTETTWQPGNPVGVTTGWAPNAQPPADDAAQYGLKPGQMQQARQFANITTMGMRPGVHRDVAYAKAIQQRVAQFHTQNMIDERAANAAKAEQTKADRAEHRDTVTKVDEKYDRLVKEFFKDQQKKIDTLRHGTKDEPGLTGDQLAAKFPDNPEYWDAAAHQKYARDQAARVMGISHPGWVPPDQRGAGGATAAGNTAPAPAGTPPAANESPPGGPGAGPGPTGQPAPADAANDAAKKLAAINAAIEAKAKADPREASVLAWDQAHRTAAAQTAALPPDANDEQKWLARRPVMTHADLADLYDRHRAERLYDPNVGGARGSAIDADEQRIRKTAEGVGTPEQWKSAQVVREGITPQAVERMRQANKAARARQKALDDADRRRRAS